LQGTRRPVGDILRTADTSAAGVLVTVNQMSPIYVAFSVPLSLLPDIRQALAAGTASVIATPRGLDPSTGQTGKVAMIDNAIDPTSGSVTIRAAFDNPNEVLWPGQICQVIINVRNDPDTVSVPTAAIQPGQTGTFVFTIDGDTAHYQPVTVARNQDGQSVISSGLRGGETAATSNQLLLVDGAKVKFATN
jgi:membrane fusion protein, multidrug efflux system